MKTHDFWRGYLRGINERATGPTWTSGVYGSYVYITTSEQKLLPRTDKQLIDPRALAQLPNDHGANGEANGELIAAMRNALPAIVDDLDALYFLESRLARIRELAATLMETGLSHANQDRLQEIIELATRGSQA